MTRINLAPPSRLADQHLFAEWREIKHIPAFLRQLLDKGKSIEEIKSKIPAQFTLNKGHKYFFVDKMRFLNDRHQDLLIEVQKREYNIKGNPLSEWWDSIKDFPKEFVNPYQPKFFDIDTSNQRILERISQRPDWYRYNGEVKDLQFFSKLLYS